MQLPLVNRLPDAGPHYGVVAEFASPGDLMRACEAVRDAGFTRWDAHCPFPVHGLGNAMGLKRSVLPLLVLVCGLGGAVAGMGLQWWTSAVDYPLVISGKPYFSWQAFVPITFELAVLGGALAAVFGMLGLNRLPMFYHPVFDAERFEKATDDAFFVSVESWDPRFDPHETPRLLRSLGAVRVELIANESAGSPDRPAREARP